MAALINPGTPSVSGDKNLQKKPILIAKIDGNDGILQAIFIPEIDGLISISADKSVRIWIRRDSGQYWPSVCQFLVNGCTCMHYHPESRYLFVGCDNGTIVEFTVAEDYNRILKMREVAAHTTKVNSIHYACKANYVISIGQDKVLHYYFHHSGKSINSYICNTWCTSLAFDTDTNHAFVGDASGLICILKLDGVGITQINTLRGHSACVRSMEWDAHGRLLISGSVDNSVVVWDIGGNKGTAYELQGHRKPVTNIRYSKPKNLLMTSDEDGIVVFWDMNARRKETVAWVESDTCQLCTRPFFWNVRAMMDQRVFGLRQHHCRGCGRAVCDKCSEGTSVIPVMGFEIDVRVCDSCKKLLKDTDLTPLAIFHESKHQIIYMDVDEARKRLVTVGKDRIAKIWDIASLL